MLNVAMLQIQLSGCICVFCVFLYLGNQTFKHECRDPHLGTAACVSYAFSYAALCVLLWFHSTQGPGAGIFDTMTNANVCDLFLDMWLAF